MKLFSLVGQEVWKNKKIVPLFAQKCPISFQVSPIPEKPN
jgi:hypothetical protein